jgi:hypothetical protein
MIQMANNDDDLDPKPLPPAPGECCGCGCSPCILDYYEEELARWKERQSRREAERADAGKPPPET